MLRRFLFTTAAAATLLAAAPAFAAEHTEAKTQPCSCCSDGSMHHPDHMLHHAQKAPGVRAGSPAVSSDPFLRNQASDDAFIRNNAFGG
jgi:hypothetical protein